MIIDENSKVPLYSQLYEQIKADILSGSIKPGTKLKSSRAVSAELHISRNTVELAYDQLFAEGFITSKPRIGYYVEVLHMEKFQECEAAICVEDTVKPDQNIVYDFRRGNLLLSELPCNQWQRLINRCFHENREDLAQQKSVFGEIGLRTEIQKYIHNYRNVNCRAEQIVVTTGTQFCLDLVCQLLKSMNKGLGVAMEEPGYDQSRITFQNNGLHIYPMELDRHGAVAQSLTATNVIAAYITPSHQFPTGVVMPISRRTEFVEWARQRDAFIIEDDYNCHFQHDLRPISSLQSLCTDRVFYIGSFSEILFPCISVSYVVIPENLLDRLHGWFDNHTPFVLFLTQKPLELFIKEGHWESHLRKMRKNQKAKCEALVSVLKNKFGESIHISGFHAGLHLLVQAQWPVKEDELVRRAYQAGAGVYPTSRYWSRPENDENGTVLLNYGGIALADIPDAVELLYKAWYEDKSGAMENFKTVLLP
ncbi:MAG: PLP-dependent aminotransferase family protein [Syntrophomonadaceae bacterium]|nr:PLP-dependent aminotransferase family protein [Syntrophomonadaceae bacterium]